MGEKTEAEGGGNERARSARLKKEREAAEARRRAAAKEPMKASTTNRTDRQQMAAADRMTGGYGGMTRSKAAMGTRASAIEELTARRDDTRNPITRMNLDNQIRELKAGGTPVQTTFSRTGARAGEVLTVGVVRGGRFSGRQGFDPGSGNVRLNPNTGAYESRYGMGGTSRSDGGERATKPATTTQSTTIQDTTNSTVSSGTDESVRLAQLSTAAAGRKRRILLGTA